MAGEPISAQAMAAAARHDPQFSVPARPRVRRGLVLRRHADHLVVEGAPNSHFLRGKAATEFLPRLLPLLDGGRDHRTLAGELGVSEANVFTALSLLWTCGVVEEAAPDGAEVEWVADHLADYLSRMGDATEANAAWEAAAGRLAAARPWVGGDAAFAAALRQELGGTVPNVAGAGADPTLVIACVTDSTPIDRALVAECWDGGLPLLRVALRGDAVEIGPYVDRRLSPCLDCLTADEDGASAVESERPAGVGGDDDLALAAAVAASDIVAFLGRAARVGLPGRWRRVNLTRMSQSQRSGATRPGCPFCSVLSVKVATEATEATEAADVRPSPVSARYEASVALPPREYADVKAHQVHYQPANVALQRGHKSWPVAPRRTLPALDFGLLSGGSAPGDPGPEAGPGLDLARLALLLAIPAGWQRETRDRVWRWTASGGNIGSVVAHVLVRDVEGLAPGVYGYVSADHELALLRAGRPDGCGADCAAPACVLFTGDLPRVASKYGAFGLRVVLLDAGCAQAALAAVGETLGVRTRVADVIDDERFGQVLDIDLDAEPVTGLVHLGEGR